MPAVSERLANGALARPDGFFTRSLLTILAPLIARLDIKRLTAAERLQLVEELWDSLSPVEIPITSAQGVELDRREALHRADATRGRPWREVLDEIERRRG